MNNYVFKIKFNESQFDLNDQYETVLGYTAEELMGTNATLLIHPDDLAKSTNKHNQIREDIDSSIDIWRFRDKNGNYRIINSSSSGIIQK